MKAKLLTFLLLGLLAALGYHLALNLAYEHFFPTSRLYVTYWYIPLVAVPALLLAGLAWGIGYFRRNSGRGDDAIGLFVLALIVLLTVGAPYSCWNGCF